MSERLISFDTAKSAKEKGFIPNQKEVYYNPVSGYEKFENIPTTQNILQKWLRVKHGLYAYIDWSTLENVIVDYKNLDGVELYRLDREGEDEEDDINELLIEALKLIKNIL